MLQVPLQEESDSGEVGAIKSCTTAYRELTNDYNWRGRQLRTERADKLAAQRRAAACESREAHRARFFDRRLLHPVVSLPPDPLSIARLLALLIAEDRRTGLSRRPVNGLRFEQDKGTDLFSAPSETNQARVGDCAKFVRQEGAFRGNAVGCARVPGGFHVWLRGPRGEVIDVCVERGMPRPPAAIYAAGVFADIPREPRMTLPQPVPDAPDVQETFTLFGDQVEWPTTADAPEDVYGVEAELVEEADPVVDEDVAGPAADATAMFGTIATALATAYGGPVGGMTAQAIAQLAVTGIARMEQQAPRQPSPRQPSRNSAQPIARAAVELAKSTQNEDDRLMAAAFAVAASENPKIVEALKARLKSPRLEDRNPKFRALLEAAVVGLHKQEYDLPLRHHRPLILSDLKPLVQGRQALLGSDVSGGWDLDNFMPDCPGTCAAK